MAPRYGSANWIPDSSVDGGHWTVTMNGDAMNEYIGYIPGDKTGAAIWVDSPNNSEGGFWNVSMTPDQMDAFTSYMPTSAGSALDAIDSYGGPVSAGPGEISPTAQALLSGPKAAPKFPGWLIALGIGAVFLIAFAKVK